MIPESANLLAQSALQFSTPISAAMWAAIAGVPVAIIGLYFLKLRRRAVQVPSTLLWRRSIEDLHVNSLFQRLRRNLLLFLQLLAVALAMFALAGPRLKGLDRQGQRLVLAVDESASMAARDVEPTRLERAKAEARKILAAMEPGDLAMIVAFSDHARIVSSYTDNKDLLRRRLDAIEPTQATTSLREALQLVAGLANPSRQIGEGQEASAVEVPRLFLFTDGGFADVADFSLGNLQPEVVAIGPRPKLPSGANPKGLARLDFPSDNVALLALHARRDEDRPERYQVFGRAHNYRAEPVRTVARLLRRDANTPDSPWTDVDARALEIEPRGDLAFTFDRADAGPEELEVRLDVADALPLDDHAYAIWGPGRRAKVLLVTAGNRYLTDAMKTPGAAELAEVTTVPPDGLKSAEVASGLEAGRFDLVIFDGVRPEQNPEANTLYFGALPPGPAFEKSGPMEEPTIVDWDLAHPLTQYIRDLNTVVIGKAIAVEPPAGSAMLIEGKGSPLAFATPRGAYVDVVVTFPLLDADRKINTTWPVRLSFPLFLYNNLRVLGSAREAAGAAEHLPARPVSIRPDAPVEAIRVASPGGPVATVSRSPQGTFVFNQAATTGIYHARWEPNGTQSFAVNLFDARESDLAPRGIVPEGVPDDQAEPYRIKIGHNPIQETRLSAPARSDYWWAVALGALGVVLVEWYIYNRRVYI